MCLNTDGMRGFVCLFIIQATRTVRGSSCVYKYLQFRVLHKQLEIPILSCQLKLERSLSFSCNCFPQRYLIMFKVIQNNNITFFECGSFKKLILFQRVLH